jgi:hypothetical protein
MYSYDYMMESLSLLKKGLKYWKINCILSKNKV